MNGFQKINDEIQRITEEYEEKVSSKEPPIHELEKLVIQEQKLNDGNEIKPEQKNKYILPAVITGISTVFAAIIGGLFMLATNPIYRIKYLVLLMFTL